MHEKEKSSLLLILLVYSAMTFLLIVESALMKWETGAIVLLFLGLIISWGAHISGKVPGNTRFWMYFTFSMLSCFFYGIHETSVYDLAPLMILIMILFTASEKFSVIRLCVITYFFIIGYDIVFVLGEPMQISALSVSRLLLHLILVYVAGQLLRYLMVRQDRERKNTERKIQELTEVNRRTEDFMANVSHELRPPINAVTGISSILLQSGECEGTIQELARKYGIENAVLSEGYAPQS